MIMRTRLPGLRSLQVDDYLIVDRVAEGVNPERADHVKAGLFGDPPQVGWAVWFHGRALKSPQN
jgi:hypothetical protein